MAYAKILQKLLQEFFLIRGRAPISATEWSKLRRKAMELARREGGDPITGPRTPTINTKIDPHPQLPFDISKDLPTTGILQQRGNIIPFPKGRRTTPAVKAMMQKGDLQVGTAPKTLPETLKTKKDRHIRLRDSEEDLARMRRENKEAVERFNKKWGRPDERKTVEDFRDEGDWDPSGMAEGGIAPLVGEPSYAADFYDDRTPMKKGKKAKKKKTARELEEILNIPRHFWRMSPMGKQIYKKKSDLPEGILEILEKDPGVDFEDFAKIYWSPEGYQWTDKGFSRGRLGSYSGMTGNIEMGMAPFGKKAYKEWELGKPHLDIKAMSDEDKAIVALHELRHKNILENRELWESQPEWVKSIEGPGYLPGGGTTGHELYTRFLDKRFNPTISDPGRHDPYFDKILRDYWEPYAQEYEKTAGRLKSEKRGEGIETLAAQGGRIGLAGGGAVVKFIEQLFIKASNDIRQGKGKWKGLTQDQWIKQHDNLTKMIKQWEWDGKKRLPPGAEEYIGMNDLQIARAVKLAEKEVIGTKKVSTAAERKAYRESDEFKKAKDLEDWMTGGKGIDQHEADEIFKQNKGLDDEQIMQKAYDEIKGGSGFTDDYKLDADVLADEYAKQKGIVYTDLPEDQISIYYEPALKRVSQDLLKRREAKKAIKDVEQKIELQMFDPKGRKPNAEGGRQDFIFGGSTGLKSLIKRMKGKEKRIFSSKLNKDKLKWAEKYLPEQADRIKSLKIEQLENLLEALQLDKQQMAMRAQHRRMNDPGLDFLMKKLEDMPESGLTTDKDLAKYVDIDKDILILEQMIKNKKMVGRKPHAMGGRISYSGGGRAGLPAVTLGMPQGPMPGPAMPPPAQGIATPGVNLQMNQMDLMQQKMQQNPWMQNQMPQGMGGTPQYQGQLRMPFAGGGMGRRAFMKLMAGIAALPFVGRGAKKAIPEATKITEEVIKRGPDGMPSYIFDLIEVVKAKGTRDFVEGIYKRSDYSTVHSYKGVDVIEDGAGNIKIKSDRGGFATDPYTGKTHEGIAQEHHMQIEKGGVGVKDEGLETQKTFQEPDEYIEGTVRPDMDGKMKDFEEGLDDDVHEFFKEIADEVDTLIIKRPKKASGGLAYALGE